MTNKIIFSPTRRALLVSAAATFVLAGCSLLSPSNPPSRIYVLEPPFGKAPGPAVNWGLAVTPTDVPNVFDTDRVSLSRDLAMDYFADTQWTDTTSRLLQSLLVEAFEKSGRIAAVARDSGGVHGDYILTSELRHFEAVYDNGDGAPEIHVEIEAKLLSLPHRDMVATHDAVQKVRASANSIPAVVVAFNAATGAAISDIVDWALAAPGAQYAGAAATTGDAAPAPVHHRRRRK
ncbi:MAG TPA: ABC-type transport auxiliary lipoprotein family protein [Rhizomicrobium sp.]|jgi:cholesterol transport system auxiliary component|nr:ABC-type transport auxiliary lipoprotein family protein [Rhizomicrobium sp.]